MFLIFIKGLIIGFAIAAPVGPIGVLCIQRSLHQGFKIGLMTGVGAALADGVYGLIAGFGFTTVSSYLIANQFWIRLIGGLFLLYLGMKTLMKSPVEKASLDDSERSVTHVLMTTFFLTLTNPMTILSFIGVFAGLGLGTVHPDYTHALLLVLGVVLGSAAWWLLLSGGIAFVLHQRLSPKVVRGINWISGLIIVSFGLLAIFKATP